MPFQNAPKHTDRIGVTYAAVDIPLGLLAWNNDSKFRVPCGASAEIEWYFDTRAGRWIEAPEAGCIRAGPLGIIIGELTSTGSVDVPRESGRESAPWRIDDAPEPESADATVAEGE